ERGFDSMLQRRDSGCEGGYVGLTLATGRQTAWSHQRVRSPAQAKPIIDLAHRRRPVLAVTGLAVEARLAAGPGVITVMAGGDPIRLRAMLSARVQPDCRAVISIGIAGGLDPALVPGDVIVATGVAAAGRRHAASLNVAQRLAARL